MPGPFLALRQQLTSSVRMLLGRTLVAEPEPWSLREQLVRWLQAGLVGFGLFLLTLLALLAAVVVLLWDRLGWITLAALAPLYAGVSAAVFARLQREVAAIPPLISQILAESAAQVRQTQELSQTAGSGNKPEVESAAQHGALLSARGSTAIHRS
jgi:hypothetical protein